MGNQSCILCRVVSGQQSVEMIYENEYVICFRDPYPATDAHAVVAPKKHFENMLLMTEEEKECIFRIHQGIQKVAKYLNIEESGFRVIINNGPDAEQELLHVHYHVIGGRKLKWEL
ncbi:histidine triad (HIT) family protein [Paenibacillus sp. DS2015]|uniref:HIT domain-containing protein n=1 Tax=Paenibacillus sp. DS2015 TaxID=3373917 RepID=UPI003D1A5A8A